MGWFVACCGGLVCCVLRWVGLLRVEKIVLMDIDCWSSDNLVKISGLIVFALLELINNASAFEVEVFYMLTRYFIL